MKENIEKLEVGNEWQRRMGASSPNPGGGGDSHMKQTGMLVVSLRGVNFGFWSR